MNDPWMTGEELAEELETTIEEVRHMRARRVGPPGRRFGKEVYYHRATVAAWRKDAACLPSGAPVEPDFFAGRKAGREKGRTKGTIR